MAGNDFCIIHIFKSNRMTESQIILIKNSWEQFRVMDSHQIGNVFYTRLFFQMPSLRTMFKPSMTEQYQKLVDMLSFRVSNLPRMDELNDDIRQLAIRHVDYGVKPEHYKLIGDALLWTLAKGLGNKWTEEMAEAWMECYKTLSETMIAAAY
jgi:hemoglobin-like flavoprotein